MIRSSLHRVLAVLAFSHNSYQFQYVCKVNSLSDKLCTHCDECADVKFTLTQSKVQTAADMNNDLMSRITSP